MSAGMSDLSTLSDADLLSLHRRGGGAASPSPAPAVPPSTGPDLSTMSNDQLRQIYRQVTGGGGAAVPGANPGALPIKVRPQNAPTTVPNPFERKPDEPQAPASFGERFAGGGDAPIMARSADTSSPLGQGLRAQADEMLIGPSGESNEAEAAASGFANTIGLNAPRNIAAGAATLAGMAGVPGFNPSFSENYQRASDRDAALARQNPKSAIGGTVAGIGASIPLLPAWTGALTPLGRVGQAAATGLSYGGLSGLIGSHDPARATREGLVGGVAGGVLGGAFEAGAKVLGRFLQAKVPYRNADGSFTPQAEQAFRSAGVDPAQIPPQLDDQLAQVFAAKGVSPAAAREAQAGEFGIPLSAGQAGGDPRAKQIEAAARSGSRGESARQAAAEFDARQSAAIGAAGDRIVAGAGRGDPAIGNPVEAGEMVGDRARAAYQQAQGEAARAQAGADDALSGIRGSAPPDAIDAGSSAIEGVRGAAARGKVAYQQAYSDFAAQPGTFAPGSFDRLGGKVREGLGPDVPIDPVLTPGASRALSDLDNLPTLLGTPDGSGPTARAVDQVRKRLVAYYQGARSNPTDQRALSRILAAYDDHTQALAEAGLFGERFAGGRGAGSAAVDVAPIAATTGPRPVPLTEFIAKNGGLPLDAEARAADMHRMFIPGGGPLARRSGKSIDGFWREKLIEEGYLPPDRDGGMARNITNELHDAISRERGGDPVYRWADRDHPAVLYRGARTEADNAHYGSLRDDAAKRIAAEHESVGIPAQDLDPDTVRRAADSLVSGEHLDPLQAYEAAVMAGGHSPRSSGERVPFPAEPGGSIPTSSALPSGSSEPADLMRAARSKFAAYQRTFKPQGAGDDVGRAMQRIVDRDAQPQEVANMLYGSSRVGNTGLSVRLADRLKSTLGEDSPHWQAIQQGLISRVTDPTSPGRIVERIDDVLRGNGRVLGQRVLTPEQRTGLAAYRNGVQQAEAARQRVPNYLNELAEGGFEANAVVNGLFGQGVPGARVGSATFAKAIKGLVGEGSPEWSAVRQAAVQRALGRTESGAPLDPARTSARLLEFTQGPGKALSRELFSAEEIGQMNRLAGALRSAYSPQGVPIPQRSEAARNAAALALNALAAGIGFKVGGPVGAGAAFGLKVGDKATSGALAARTARRSFEGGAAPAMLAAPVPATQRIGTGVGVGLESR